MNTTNDPRWNDTSITKSSGNVFLDLGFDPAEAEAARQLHITQPRVSRLIKGKVEDFSLDMLLTLATRAGLYPELRLSA